MLHTTCTHRGQVNSRLLMVGSQTSNLTPDLSFCHNLCCICPNGSCKPIFDIYASIAFQRYKERPNERCSDLCNQILKFWKSRWTPKFPFWECESHPHTLLKVGYQQIRWKYCVDKPLDPSTWPLQVGINLSQIEMIALEKVGFVLCEVCKCVPRTFFANESITPHNQPADLEAWPKIRNNKPIWRATTLKLST